MQYCPGRHQIVSALLNRIFKDIEPADFERRRLQAGHAAQVDVTCHHMPIWPHPSSEPLRDRAIAAPYLKTSPSRAKSKPLDVAAFHRVEQLRHQGKPLLFAA